MFNENSWTMKKSCFVVAAFVSLFSISCNSPKNNETPEKSFRTVETEKLLNNLINIPSQGYLYGHHDDPVYGVGWSYEPNRSDVKDVCGDYPGLMTFDLGHIELGDSVNLDGVPFDLIRKETVNQYKRGGVISYSWHLNNPLTGGDSWDVSDSTVVASILKGGTNHEKFLTWLDKLSAFLNSLVTEDGVKVPIIFRPWHEHTGSWFWWGEKLCTVDQYKALWTLTTDCLKAKGVDNVLFAYSPGSEANGVKEKYLERYPGDDLIDILGLDMYCYGDPKDPLTLSNYKQGLSLNLGMVCEIASEHGKVAALTETGFESIPVAEWWTNAFQAVCDSLPIAYAQTWRNAHDKPGHFYGPYPGHSSSEEFIKFYNSPKSLFVNDLKNLYK